MSVNATSLNRLRSPQACRLKLLGCVLSTKMSDNIVGFLMAAIAKEIA
jgi:hypothetical protein